MKTRKWRIKHTAQRLHQRYGIKLSQEVQNSIVHQIRSGKSRFIRAESNERTVHEVVLDDKNIIVVYDKRRQLPITVLPQQNGEKNDI